MRKISVFNHVTLDGFICDPDGDMQFAHANDDAQSQEFAAASAQSGGTLLMGRVTYEMMVAYWPTPQAKKQQPAIAEGMNAREKIVFSRTLHSSDWENTKLVNGDLLDAVKKLKRHEGPDMVILGSASIVSQLSAAKLIDEYRFVMNPVVIGRGKTMFATVEEELRLRRTAAQTFENGNILLTYVVR